MKVAITSQTISPTGWDLILTPTRKPQWKLPCSSIATICNLPYIAWLCIDCCGLEFPITITIAISAEFSIASCGAWRVTVVVCTRHAHLGPLLMRWIDCFPAARYREAKHELYLDP